MGRKGNLNKHMKKVTIIILCVSVSGCVFIKYLYVMPICSVIEQVPPYFAGAVIFRAALAPGVAKFKKYLDYKLQQLFDQVSDTFSIFFTFLKSGYPVTKSSSSLKPRTLAACLSNVYIL